ncbi:hypothetical protein [Streptomyces sp. NPDC058466]|uniref:hypothetical protein n=1 Tax=Streptomyces sp. NPDC058466 TaxID=3346512 RepID=UPI00364D18E5
MFGRKAAEKLDSAAAALHSAGTKVGGKAGGRAGDAVANAVIAPVRSRINEDCTRCARGKCKQH